MRILYLHQYFATPAVAAGTRSYEFCRRLIGSGHDVTMVTSDAFLPAEFKGRNGKWDTVIDGIKVIVIPQPYSNQMSFAKRIEAFLFFAFKASLLSIRGKVDVVFATSTPLTIAIPGIIQKYRKSAPLVFEVRDLWPEMPIAMGALRNPMARFLARSLEWIAYQSAQQIVALSPGMAEGVVRGGGKRAKVSVIPNACDLDLFQIAPDIGRSFRREVLGFDEGAPLLVYAGTFGHVNGVGYAIEVARHLQQRGAKTKIILVGAGVEKPLVMDLARKYGVLDRTVKILGPLPKLEIPALLSSATAIASLFIPVKEMWHNSANKFFDALAAGKPVVINYGGWQASLLEESGAGLMLDNENPSRAAEQLEEFLTNPRRLQVAAAASTRLAEGKFNRSELARQFENVLRRAVS